MTDLQQIADNLAGLGLPHPEIADAVIKLTNAANPARGVVDEAMVERACAAYDAVAIHSEYPVEFEGMLAALQSAQFGVTAEFMGWVHEVAWADGTSRKLYQKEPTPLDDSPGLTSQRVVRVFAQPAAPSVPSVPEWTAVLDALDAVNEAANDARHRGEYGKANKLVKARVTLYRAALANEEPATPKDQP